MSQSRIYFNSSITINLTTNIIYQLLLLNSTVLVIILSVISQGQYTQASLANQTVESNNQTAPSVGNLRAGSFGDDRISGTDIEDIIIGLLGSDTINGGEGNDKIQGNEDSDKLYGDLGNDILQGGIGSDQIFGREGDDVLIGGIDDDYLVGDEGNDQIYGSEGDDILIGNSGADYFDCGEGTDVTIDFNVSEGDDNVGDCEEIIGTESIPVG
jgi:Ca2+-binding RTX toxin-like protein